MALVTYLNCMFHEKPLFHKPNNWDLYLLFFFLMSVINTCIINIKLQLCMIVCAELLDVREKL